MNYKKEYNENGFTIMDNFLPVENYNKMIKEMKSAISKENYLNPEDAKLINEFINKIQKELSN